MDLLGPQLTSKQKLAFITNPLFNGVRIPKIAEAKTLEKMLPGMTPEMLDLLGHCLALDPKERWSAEQCLKHPYFESLGDEI